MKKRILSLLLASCLLSGLLALPAEAANAKDVYNYLVSFAKQGYHDTRNGCYACDVTVVEESTGTVFSVYYWESDKEVEVTIFNDSFELTMTLTSAMKLPYTAFMMLYDSGYTTGEVQVKSNYNGEAFSSFSKFSGNSSLKSDMLKTVNTLLPALIELTRIVLQLNSYTLKDMGLSSYNKCVAVHCWDNGAVTRQATCGADGAKVYRCTVCGATETETLPATGNHTWDNGAVTRQPTCVGYGERTYQCKVCGAKKTDSVEPTYVHLWDKGTVLTEPTCTEPGLRLLSCATCSNTKNETIPALGHAWTPTETAEEGETLHESAAKYSCSRCGETKEARLCAGEIFTDMPADDNYAHDPIDWAYFHEPQITAGTASTAFSPKNTCTRGQVVTFLWRAVGKPLPGEDESTENPFEDVKENAYYYDAVLWAVGQGVTTGASPTKFNPNGKCTRAQVVTFLWRAAGEPAPAGSDSLTDPENPFEDVKENAYYYDAVLWAVGQGVTTGASPTKFNPNGKCTRAQVVTFLYRAQ